MSHRGRFRMSGRQRGSYKDRMDSNPHSHSHSKQSFSKMPRGSNINFDIGDCFSGDEDSFERGRGGNHVRGRRGNERNSQYDRRRFDEPRNKEGFNVRKSQGRNREFHEEDRRSFEEGHREGSRESFGNRKRRDSFRNERSRSGEPRNKHAFNAHPRQGRNRSFDQEDDSNGFGHGNYRNQGSFEHGREGHREGSREIFGNRKRRDSFRNERSRSGEPRSEHAFNAQQSRRRNQAFDQEDDSNGFDTALYRNRGSFEGGRQNHRERSQESFDNYKRSDSFRGERSRFDEPRSEGAFNAHQRQGRNRAFDEEGFGIANYRDQGSFERGRGGNREGSHESFENHKRGHPLINKKDPFDEPRSEDAFNAHQSQGWAEAFDAGSSRKNTSFEDQEEDHDSFEGNDSNEEDDSNESDGSDDGSDEKNIDNGLLVRKTKSKKRRWNGRRWYKKKKTGKGAILESNPSENNAKGRKLITRFKKFIRHQAVAMSVIVAGATLSVDSAQTIMAEFDKIMKQIVKQTSLNSEQEIPKFLGQLFEKGNIVIIAANKSSCLLFSKKIQALQNVPWRGARLKTRPYTFLQTFVELDLPNSICSFSEFCGLCKDQFGKMPSQPWRRVNCEKNSKGDGTTYQCTINTQCYKRYVEGIPLRNSKIEVRKLKWEL